MGSSTEKMSFYPNPDPLKQAQEVIVLWKINKPIIVIQLSKAIQLKKFSYQKLLGMFLDGKLDFDKHIKGILDKTSKFIGFMRKSFEIFYRHHLFWKSINLLLDLT